MSDTYLAPFENRNLALIDVHDVRTDDARRQKTYLLQVSHRA